MAENGVIGALRVLLSLDTAQFEVGLKRSQGKLADFAKTAQAAGAVAAVALAGAAVAIGAATKAAIDRADELSKASQKYGVAVDELSRLAHAADLSDVSLEQLGGGLKKLAANMVEVASGGGEKAAKAFKSLGVSVTDASGSLRSNTAVMSDVAEKFAGMEDGAGKTALAMAVFGKSGTDLIPLLNSGRDGLAEMAAEADQLGLTLSTNTAQQAEAFNDNLTRLQAAGQGVATQIAAGLLPGLVSLSETFVAGAKNAEFMAQVTSVLNGVLKVLSVTGVVLGAVFDATFKTVTAAARAVMQIVRGDLSGAMSTLNQKLDSFDGIGERVAKAWNATGQSVSMTAQRVSKEAAPAIERAGETVKKTLSDQEKAHKKASDEIDRYVEAVRREQQTAGLSSQQVKILDAQAMALKALEAGYVGAAHAIAAYAAALIEAESIERKQIETSVDLERTGQQASEEWGKQIEEAARDARQAIDDLPYAIDDVWHAFKNRDWSRVLDGLKGAIDGISFAFSSMGTTADKVNSVAGVANGIGQLIGGKAGRALSNAAVGAQVGMTFGGPIGAGIGAVIGGLSSLLGGKKSNNAAIAQISGDRVTLAGNKRTDETSAAASDAANAIISAQKLLNQAGISLAKSVTAIDIGTRDMTHIFLSTGEELRSAVGDPAAAAETALRALLQSATYANDAQKALVESMLAAGKGFDEITAGLQSYLAAQAIPGQIADAILALTDPKASDVELLKREQQARRDSVKAAADAGYITADTFAAVTVQLAKLEGLELDQVLAKYAGTIGDATEAAAQLLEEKQRAAAEAVDQAREELRAAFDAQADVYRDTISRYSSIAEGLRRFDDSLKSQTSRSPQAALALARAAFLSVAGKTDDESLSKLEDLGKAYIDAQRAAAKSSDEVAFVQAQVRAATVAGAEAAESQVDAAQAQLEALTAQVSQFIELNTTAKSIEAAILALGAALSAQAALVVPVAANDGLATLQKFATSGSFKVGGYGGADSKIAQMALTPNEYVSITKGDSLARMADEMRALRSVVARQSADLGRMAGDARQTANVLTSVTRDGRSLLTTAA